MDEPARERLVGNIVGHATQGVTADVQKRVVEYWRRVDGDLGARAAKGLNAS
ncbi:MAG: catalase-related domain-containing protein [Streptosporangiaceae bacterium]